MWLVEVAKLHLTIHLDGHQTYTEQNGEFTPRPRTLPAVALYGGYFNGGLGIILLALFSLWGMADLDRMNALKSGLSFLLSAISVAVFAVAGLVAWPQAAVMMLAATAGGYAGAPLARALPKPVVRGVIATVGFGMSAIFFWRLIAAG